MKVKEAKVRSTPGAGCLSLPVVIVTGRGPVVLTSCSQHSAPAAAAADVIPAAARGQGSGSFPGKRDTFRQVMEVAHYRAAGSHASFILCHARLGATGARAA